MSGEAQLHISGIANQQNCCFWALENPRELYEKAQHSPKVTVCCAVGIADVIGPYFLKAIIEMGLLWTARVTSLHCLCQNHNGSIYIFNVSNFSRMGWRPIHPEHQQRLFIFSSVSAAFPRFAAIRWSSSASGFVYVRLLFVEKPRGTYISKKPSTVDNLKEGICVEITQIDRTTLERVKPTSKNTFRNASMKTDTTQWMLFFVLDYDKR